MHRYELDPDGAFSFLVRSSSHSNTKVRDIAVRMVEEHEAEVEGRSKPS